MSKTIDVFSKELSSLRTEEQIGMLDLIKVDVYGQKMPINQIATITTPEPDHKYSSMGFKQCFTNDLQLKSLNWFESSNWWTIN